MAKDNFSETLISDLKKQAILIHLSKNDLGVNETKSDYFNSLGYNFKTQEDVKQFIIHLLKMDTTGPYKENFIASYQNTIFFLEENNNNISNIHFSYITYHKSLVHIKSCENKNIICESNTGKSFTFECINQNEFAFLENKTCYALVSCFANKINIKNKEELTSENSPNGEAESCICEGSYAKLISGEITDCRKILNIYSNLMFYEVIINCLGLKIAVIIPDNKVNEQDLKKGKILRCNGHLCAIINEIYSKAIDKSLILNAARMGKKYLVCITTNKNAILFLNINKDGKINENKSYVFNTLDIKEISLQKVYNGIYNVKLKIKVKKGKGFTCYIENKYSETIDLLSRLDCVKII